MRAGQPVESFLSCLGSIRETRLTATLAYLVSRFPEEFLPLFLEKTGNASSVHVEETEGGDRYDIIVKDGRHPIILEGKVGIRQNPRQLLRYVRTVQAIHKRRPKLVIIDVGSKTAQSLGEDFRKLAQKLNKKPYFCTWDQVAKICRKIIRKKVSFKNERVAAAIAEDMLNHLEENQMTTNERPEVYLRELSSESSVRLYFRYGIYASDPKFLRSAQNNLYFAPYFTRRTADRLSGSNLVPIGEGISYVSRIKEIQVVPKKHILKFLKTIKTIEDPKTAFRLIRGHRQQEVMLLLLGKPYLAFIAPVTKKKLGKVDTHQKFTQGTLGSRSCTLEELLAASHI